MKKRPEIEDFMRVLEYHMDLDYDERQLIHEEANTLYNKLVTDRQEMIDALIAAYKDEYLARSVKIKLENALTKAGVHMEESA